MQNGTATLEDSLVVPCKTKHSLTMWSSNFTQTSWKLMFTENSHMNVYGSFIQHCQKLEAIKMSFNKWVDKLWYIHTMEYCSAIKRNKLSNHKKTWRTLKCILLSERSQSEKATCCMNPTTWHFSSVQFSRSVVSDSLQPHEPQHARPPCPSPTPGIYTNSCPLSQWCHPAISSSVFPFSSCPQILPASGSFPMSQLFTWGGQSTGVSASASVLPMNT